MKILLITCILASAIQAQDRSGLDLVKLGEALRVSGTELKIENVTEREAQARKLPLKSAWIVSAPGHELFFPLVIYTAPKGVLHTKKHEALRKAIREKPPKEGDFGYGLGFFDVSKIGECFVFMEEIVISSNNPARVENGIPLPAWYPTRKSILSIIGTLESENLDFQIGLLLLDERKLEDFPGFKSMLYGPDFVIPKELASGIVEVVRDSSILIAAKDLTDKRSENDIQEKSRKAEDLGPASLGATKERGKPDVNSANTGLPLWTWPLGVGVLLVALVGLRRGLSGNR